MFDRSEFLRMGLARASGLFFGKKVLGPGTLVACSLVVLPPMVSISPIVFCLVGVSPNALPVCFYLRPCGHRMQLRG